MTYAVYMPLFVMLPRKTMADKKMPINLNSYRNWNFTVCNIVKKAYQEIAIDRLGNFTVPAGCKVGLTFRLIRGDRRRVDRANFLSVAEKFFADAMTQSGCIPDDNDNHITWSHYESGPIDKANPRVEIEIEVLP